MDNFIKKEQSRILYKNTFKYRNWSQDTNKYSVNLKTWTLLVSSICLFVFFFGRFKRKSWQSTAWTRWDSQHSSLKNRRVNRLFRPQEPEEQPGLESQVGLRARLPQCRIQVLPRDHWYLHWKNLTDPVHLEPDPGDHYSEGLQLLCLQGLLLVPSLILRPLEQLQHWRCTLHLLLRHRARQKRVERKCAKIWMEECRTSFKITWTTGIVDLYWNEFLVRSTSIGNSLASFIMSAHSLWKVVSPDISLRSWKTISWTCLLSKSSNLTKTSERSLAKRWRASERQRRTRLQKETIFLKDLI